MQGNFLSKHLHKKMKLPSLRSSLNLRRGRSVRIELVKDKASGQTKYVANGSGTAYLKYVIDEDVYQTATMASQTPDQYITNDDITTAVIQINVNHKHKLTRHAPKAPTCTEDGNKVYWKCSDDSCGKIFSDKDGINQIFVDETVIPKTGHSWGEWETTVEPTETAEGEVSRECLHGCGEKQTKTIPVKSHEHKLVKHAAAAPTCTEDGNIVYWTCSDDSCGKIFSDKDGQNEITKDQILDPKTGHSWDNGIMTKAPSTTKEGTMEYTCKNCGEVETKAIAKLQASNIFAKVSSDKTSQRISWTKVNGADGYTVYFTPCTNNETVGNYDLVKTVNNKTYSFTKKGLKKGRVYKSYVEAFKKVNGKKVVLAKSLSIHSITGNYNSKYTNPKKVTTGKAKIAVKKGKKYKIKGNKIKYYNKKRKALKHEAAYRYKSTNTKVATVSSKGVIKGKSKGSCKVHVIANNGVEAVIKVTVK